MKKRYLKIASHIIAWALFLSAPVLFLSHDNAPAHLMSGFILIPWILLIAFYYSNYYIFIPKVLFKKRVLFYILILLSCLISFLFFRDALILFNIKPLPPHIPPGSMPMPPPDSMKMPMPMDVIANLSSIVLFLLAFIISTSIAVINELFNTWNQKQQAEVEKSKAELAFLQSQVNPHFLFNTLYSIYSLTLEKSDKAPEAVMKLSDIMRFVLTESQYDTIPLQQEIDYISKYIDLQQLRISEKTKVNFEINGDCSKKLIAPLLLIPFVENAFKYGVSSHVQTSIDIALNMSDKSLEFIVSNNKFGQIDGKEKNNIGIDNATKRLQLLYPHTYGLSIIDEENQFVVKLTIERL